MTANTTRLMGMLRNRHPPPEWVLATEVQVERHKTLRFADAIAIRTRKGLVEVHGFEVKVSRADLLNEVKDPEKAERASDYCDFWWLVLGNHAISTDGIPDWWGVLAPADDGSLVVRRPPAFETKRPAIDRDFLAAVLRRVDPMEPVSYWTAKVREAESKGYAKGRSEGARYARSRQRKGSDEDPDAPLDLP